MATFRVLGGDFAAKECFTTVGAIALYDPAGRSPVPDLRVPRSDVIAVVPATPGGMGVAGATATGAAIGYTVAGEGGLIAGTVFGSLPRNVAFVVTLRDGRRFVAEGSTETYQAFVKDAARSPRP